MEPVSSFDQGFEEVMYLNSSASRDQTEDEGGDHDHGDDAEDDLLPTDRAGLLFRDLFLLFLLLRHVF